MARQHGRAATAAASYSIGGEGKARMIDTPVDFLFIVDHVEIDALTDGLLTLRYLFGLQGDTLINGVVE